MLFNENISPVSPLVNKLFVNYILCLTIRAMGAIIIKRSRDARVVELADSLDSGSSAHSGRAGSSPASRTKQRAQSKDFGAFFFSACGTDIERNHQTLYKELHLSPSQAAHCL